MYMSNLNSSSSILDRRLSKDPSYSGGWLERNGGKLLTGLLAGATALSLFFNGSHRYDSTNDSVRPNVKISSEDNNR